MSVQPFNRSHLPFDYEYSASRHAFVEKDGINVIPDTDVPIKIEIYNDLLCDVPADAKKVAEMSFLPMEFQTFPLNDTKSINFFKLNDTAIGFHLASPMEFIDGSNGKNITYYDYAHGSWVRQVIERSNNMCADPCNEGERTFDFDTKKISGWSYKILDCEKHFVALPTKSADEKAAASPTPTNGVERVSAASLLKLAVAALSLSAMML
jgi:hypothetical protein